MLSDRPTPKGHAFHVTQEMQPSPGENKRALLDAESVWTHGTVGRGTYESGLRITDATPEAKQGIQVLMNKSAGSD